MDNPFTPTAGTTPPLLPYPRGATAYAAPGGGSRGYGPRLLSCDCSSFH